MVCWLSLRTGSDGLAGRAGTERGGFNGSDDGAYMGRPLVLNDYVMANAAPRSGPHAVCVN